MIPSLRSRPFLEFGRFGITDQTHLKPIIQIIVLIVIGGEELLDDLAKFGQAYVVNKLAENFATQNVLLIVILDEELADDLAKFGQSYVVNKLAKNFATQSVLLIVIE